MIKDIVQAIKKASGEGQFAVATLGLAALFMLLGMGYCGVSDALYYGSCLSQGKVIYQCVNEYREAGQPKVLVPSNEKK